jgi:hypothetical protein
LRVTRVTRFSPKATGDKICFVVFFSLVFVFKMHDRHFLSNLIHTVFMLQGIQLKAVSVHVFCSMELALQRPLAAAAAAGAGGSWAAIAIQTNLF